MHRHYQGFKYLEHKHRTRPIQLITKQNKQRFNEPWKEMLKHVAQTNICEEKGNQSIIHQ